MTTFDSTKASLADLLREIREGIPRDRYDSILNKTPISYTANRKIGGDAPSAYLPRIQGEKQVQLTDADMDSLLQSHALAPGLLRNDEWRKRSRLPAELLP